MYSLPFECGQLTSGYNFRERCSPSLSQHLRIANNSMVRPGILCPILLSMMRFSLTWACTGLVSAVTATVVHVPSCHAVSTKSCFLIGIHYLFFLYSFCPLFRSDLSVFGGRHVLCMFPLGLSILESLIFCTSSSCGSLG